MYPAIYEKMKFVWRELVTLLRSLMVRPKPKSYKTNAPNGAKKKEEDQNMGVFSCFSHFFGTLAKTPDNTAKYNRSGCLEILNTE